MAYHREYPTSIGPVEVTTGKNEGEAHSGDTFFFTIIDADGTSRRVDVVADAEPWMGNLGEDPDPAHTLITFTKRNGRRC